MYTPFLWQRARLVVGLEFSEDHLRTILRRHGYEPGVRFLRASAEALPFRDGSFDFLLCTEVLEHLRNDRQALAEATRVLAPGGRAVISVPVSPAPIRDREHVREGYTFADLEALLSEVGLEAGKPRYCLFGISRMTMRIAAWYSEHVGLPLPSLLKVPLYLERLRTRQGSGGLPYDLVLEVRKPAAGKGQGMGAEKSRETVPAGGVR
jgi:SAM-dependent methyltransferase